MQLLVTITTFFVFFLEALLHYNIGRHGGIKHYLPTIYFQDGDELVQILIALTIFSVFNGYIVAKLST